MILPVRTRKKGFTLVETVIAMTVTFVLLSMILSLIVAVIKNTEKNDHENAVHNDLNIAVLNTSNWYNSFGAFESGDYLYDFSPVVKSQNSGGEDVYTVTSESELLAVYDADSETEDGIVSPIATLHFDGGSKLFYASNRYSRYLLTNVDRITFLKKGKIVKASIYYDGESIPMILLLSNERL